MRVIAITGGIGSGKSTVRRMFEELGAIGVDADELARQVVSPGSEGAKLLKETFGPEFFDKEGHLDRKMLAQKVFCDPDERLKLERLLHPLIRAAERKKIRDIRKRASEAVVVVEIPLLVEASRVGDYEGVILVEAPEGVRVRRLVHSGKYSLDQAAARMAAQVEDVQRVRFATWIVDNGGDMESTVIQVKNIYNSLVKNRPGPPPDGQYP